ncbi:Aste57867_24894 [Aphanomyces stellatus]|uniref:Aste57867_24894 protein n=1 Tax=Aphanomyces stellatus TaxID=120398 RepID=A0A485LRQ8_9STRA|nr:hypothetical protein As57867_024816 [Aphanomyces stellatus]VFU01528.1 Aste57867_24894 [Aphanomyces stellatus]
MEQTSTRWPRYTTTFKGNDMQLLNWNGTTPLWIASCAGHVNVVEALVARCAEVNMAQEVSTTKLGGACHVTSTAAFIGHFDIAQLLLNKGANVNKLSKVNFVKCPSLDSLVHWTDLRRCGKPPAKGADVDAAQEVCIGMSSYFSDVQDGCSPLWISSYNGHANIARLLVEQGADVNAADMDEYSLLCTAAQNGKLDVVQLLLKHGANVNQRTKVESHTTVQYFMVTTQHGHTPLRAASLQGHVNAAVLLLAHGANVDAAPEVEIPTMSWLIAESTIIIH